MIGNSTFKLLLDHIREREADDPSCARIAELNPIADTIGYLNLKSVDVTDARVLLKLAELIMEKTESKPWTEAGFNIREDVVRFVSELKKQLAVLV